MRTWPPSLMESANPTLNAYGAILVPQVVTADAAVEKVSIVGQKMTDFRTFGERQQLFNEANGLRKGLHGDVEKLVHARPEWNLGRANGASLRVRGLGPVPARSTMSRFDIEQSGQPAPTILR